MAVPVPDVQVLIKAFYLMSAVSILTARFVPFTRDRFLSYGARDIRAPASKANVYTKSKTSTSKLGGWLSYILNLQVPHSWFTHFYVVSIYSSFFWLYQCCTREPIFIALTNTLSSDTYTSSPYRLVACWVCMLSQGSRRLYECIVFSKASESRMWVGHYVIGIAFYLVTNVAIWTEHAATIQSTNFTSLSWTQETWSTKYSDSIYLLLFATASKYQHDCHQYLASLRKYSLPDQGLFKSIVAPHYTAECAIYLSLALLGAPGPWYLNTTMCCTLIFVVVNLGVTADGTKQWMKEKFRDRTEDINRRWKMIPGVW